MSALRFVRVGCLLVGIVVLAAVPPVIATVPPCSDVATIDDGRRIAPAAPASPAITENKSQTAELGSTLPAWSALPFVGLLLSIALFPLLAPQFWHHHYGKVSAAWALILAIPFVIAYQGEGIHEILHIMLKDYLPFIILLWSLYTVAGGILLEGHILGTPAANTSMLATGTLIASWVGTTGASMLLIRPVLRMNKHRHLKSHIVVFFIFLVSNIGGSLTPLGDPPLFLGFLHQVPFFWTLKLLPNTLLVAGSLLLVFYIFDSLQFKREQAGRFHLHPEDIDVDFDLARAQMEIAERVEVVGGRGEHRKEVVERLRIRGLFNIILLAGIMGAVLMSGVVRFGEFSLFGVELAWQDEMRDALLIAIGLVSLKFTPLVLRHGNGFTWGPIQEVAKLFAGIFITIIPLLAMLRAGAEGPLAFLINSVKAPWHYFWASGSLSSFLDNAPTYLTFFNTALGNLGLTEREVAGALRVGHVVLVQDLGHELATGVEKFEPLLKAISCGAVFMGANTYIGNAPNFMVKSIAEENGLKMPSFFGYMVYSLLILMPLFVLTSLIFF